MTRLLCAAETVLLAVAAGGITPPMIHHIVFHAEAMAPAFDLPPLGLRFQRTAKGPHSIEVHDTLLALHQCTMLRCSDAGELSPSREGDQAIREIAEKLADWNRLIGQIGWAVRRGIARIDEDPLYAVFTAGSPNDPAYSCGMEEERFNLTVGTLLALNRFGQPRDPWEAIGAYFRRTTPRRLAVA